MKKIFLILIVIFLHNCAVSNRPLYQEASNFNILDFGSYKVSIDRRFVLLGDLEGLYDQEAFNIVETVDIKQTRYLFVDISEGQSSIKKAIVVSLHEITNPRHYWIKIDFDEYKGPYIDQGMINLNGIKCTYLIRTISGISKDIMKLGASKDFYMDKDIKHGIQIQFTKIISRSKAIGIEYIEGSHVDFENNFNESRRVLKTSLNFIKLEK